MKKILLFIFSFVSMLVSAQQTYTNFETRYKDGEAVYGLTNDKISIAINGYTSRLSYNGKEYFLEIVLTSNKDTFTFDPSKITAYVDAKGKQKPVEFYTYDKYMSKVKRNFILWGPSATTTTSTTTNSTSNVDYNGNKGKVTTQSNTTITSANEQFYEEKEKGESWVRECYLRKNTLVPGTPLHGVIVAKKPAAYPVHLTLEIDGDIYKVDLEKPESN